MLPCPAGWSEARDSDEGFATCEPPTSEVECAPGTARFVGDEACAAIGAACAEWPEIEGRAVYARAGATVGDGSRERPFGTLALAIEAATNGTTIALAAGDYPGEHELPAGVSLVGACLASTRLYSTTPDRTNQSPVLLLRARNALRDVTFAPSARFAIGVLGDATISHIEIDGATDVGIVTGPQSQVSIEHVAIHDIEAVGSLEDSGHAIFVGGRATIREVAIDRTDGGGLALVGVVEADAMRISTGAGGDDCVRQEAGSLVLTNSLLERCGDDGLQSRAPATFEVSDTVVRDPVAIGILLLDAPTGVVTRTLVERAVGQGIYVRGGSLELTDVIVRDTPESYGLLVGGGHTTLSRVAMLRNGSSGFFAGNDGAQVLGTDVFVHGSREAPDRVPAMQMQRGAHVELERVSLLRNTVAAINATSFATAVLRDLHVGSTEASTLDGTMGFGIAASRQSNVEIERAVLEHNHDTGVVVQGAIVAMRDVVISDTMPRSCGEDACRDQPGGHALVSSGAATVSLERFAIDGATLCGYLLGPDSSLDLRTGLVARAQIGACVQADDYDFARLSDGVLYESNGANLDATRLPVPDLAIGETEEPPFDP